MLLIELTLASGLQRLSDKWIPTLTHNWKGLVSKFEAPQRKISKKYGGYVSLSFGSISFIDEVFSADWPPPLDAAITVKYTATNEATAETLFTGKCYLASIDQLEITYDIYDTAYTVVETASTVFNDTLVNVFTALCSNLSLTLNSSAARGPSPPVNYTLPGDILTIKLMDEMAAAYSHCFYISGTTLFLIDMLADNGTEAITEFQFFDDSKYWQDTPVYEAKTDNFSQVSSYSYGGTETVKQYHPTQANVEAYLSDILTIMAKPQATINMPFLGGLPALGKSLTWTDTTLYTDTAINIRARSFRFDFENDEIQITGEGSFT